MRYAPGSSVRHRMAFLILAHQDLTQLRRLCCALGPDDDIYVHVDRKTILDARTIGAFQPNVTFVMSRVTAHWAHISILEATVKLIEAALESGHDYLRLVLLSGSYYPIRPIAALRQRFLLDPTRTTSGSGQWTTRAAAGSCPGSTSKRRSSRGGNAAGRCPWWTARFARA